MKKIVIEIERFIENSFIHIIKGMLFIIPATFILEMEDYNNSLFLFVACYAIFDYIVERLRNKKQTANAS